MEMLPPEQEPLPIRATGPEEGILSRLDRYVALLTRVLFGLAGVGLVGMLLLIVADIIGIKILSRPVPGGIEIVSFLAVVTIGGAVAYTQVVHGHVAVDFIVEKFPRRARLVIDLVMIFFSICLLALLSLLQLQVRREVERHRRSVDDAEDPLLSFRLRNGCVLRSHPVGPDRAVREIDREGG